MHFDYQLQIFKQVFLIYFRTLGLELDYEVLDLTLRQLSYRKTALLITIVQGCTASSLDTLCASLPAMRCQTPHRVPHIPALSLPRQRSCKP